MEKHRIGSMHLSNLLDLAFLEIEICLKSKLGQSPYFQIGTNVP